MAHRLIVVRVCGVEADDPAAVRLRDECRRRVGCGFEDQPPRLVGHGEGRRRVAVRRRRGGVYALSGGDEPSCGRIAGRQGGLVGSEQARRPKALVSPTYFRSRRTTGQALARTCGRMACVGDARSDGTSIVGIGSWSASSKANGVAYCSCEGQSHLASPCGSPPSDVIRQRPMR
jgi:hypothetical protein